MFSVPVPVCLPFPTMPPTTFALRLSPDVNALALRPRALAPRDITSAPWWYYAIAATALIGIYVLLHALVKNCCVAPSGRGGNSGYAMPGYYAVAGGGGGDSGGGGGGDAGGGGGVSPFSFFLKKLRRYEETQVWGKSRNER